MGTGALARREKNPHGISAEALGKDTDLHTTIASPYFMGDQRLTSHADFWKSLSPQRAAAGCASFIKPVSKLVVAGVSKSELTCFKHFQHSPAKIKGWEKHCSRLKPSPKS